MAGRFTFSNQDHSTGSILCAHLDRDARVRASGYVIRDNNLLLQVDADEPEAAVADAIRSVVLEIQRIRSSLQAQLQV